MVNHFASLLANFDLWERKVSVTDSGVIDTEEDVLAYDANTYLSSGGQNASLEAVRKNNPFIDPTYQAVKLPAQLEQVHRLLFPEGSDRQVLLYGYLCLLEATDYAPAACRYDSRVTYALGDALYSGKAFDFLGMVSLLTQRNQVLDNMFLYRVDACDASYENLWRLHFNSVYRLAGLLLAYTQRVHLVWASTQA